MDEGIKFFIGLDAHKDSTSVAACEAGREPARFAGTVGPDVRPLLKVLAKAGDPAQVSVVYEAGPTGYGLYRELRRRGYRCEIVAPSLIPRRPSDRVKNDRRDCTRLAELSRAGELKPIWVPDEAHEAMRNLWRAREDGLGMRLRARQQLKAFLLRHARRYPGKTSWTTRHERWIAEQCFDHEADRIALAEYQLAAQSADQRVQRLTFALTEATRGWRFEGVVAALRALRGIDTVSAIGLVCEIGDIGRFASARHLMGYLGLVPSEFAQRLEGSAALVQAICEPVFSRRAAQQGLRGGSAGVDRLRLGHCAPGVPQGFTGSITQRQAACGDATRNDGKNPRSDYQQKALGQPAHLERGSFHGRIDARW